MQNGTSPAPRSKGVSVIGALAGMLVTFVGGVYVGLHPSWIPIKGSGSTDSGMPAKMGGTSVMSTPDHPVPATLPTTMGTMGK